MGLGAALASRCPTGDSAREGFAKNAKLMIPVLWALEGLLELKCPGIRGQLWGVSTERIPRARLSRQTLSLGTSLPISPQVASFCV